MFLQLLRHVPHLPREVLEHPPELEGLDLQALKHFAEGAGAAAREGASLELSAEHSDLLQEDGTAEHFLAGLWGL